MELIDKDAVVAWVTEKREAALYRQHNLERIGQETYVNQMIADSLGRILSFIDTLDIKEVDIDSEIDLWVKNLHSVPNFEELNKFARHFFELGLKLRKD